MVAEAMSRALSSLRWLRFGATPLIAVDAMDLRVRMNSLLLVGYSVFLDHSYRSTISRARLCLAPERRDRQRLVSVDRNSYGKAQRLDL